MASSTYHEQWSSGVGLTFVVNGLAILQDEDLNLVKNLSFAQVSFQTISDPKWIRSWFSSYEREEKQGWISEENEANQTKGMELRKELPNWKLKDQR